MSSTIEKCPVCSSNKLFSFDRIKNLNGTVCEISSCEDCSVLINVEAYRTSFETSVEHVQSTDLYTAFGKDLDYHLSEISKADAMIDVLMSLSGNTKISSFLDFGAGRGYVSMAAAARAEVSYACEWIVEPIVTLKGFFPNSFHNLRIIPDLSKVEVPVDCLFMWHALEHLPQPTSFWTRNKKCLTANALIFLQIPLYRPAYIVDCHYLFYGERSLTAWAKAIDAECLKFEYDIENGFLTLVARRRLT